MQNLCGVRTAITTIILLKPKKNMTWTDLTTRAERLKLSPGIATFIVRAVILSSVVLVVVIIGKAIGAV